MWATQVLPMLRRLIGEDVEMRVDLVGQGLLTVLDAAQFDQLVLNLALNGRDAMPQGGTLVISTGIVSGPSKDASLEPEGPVLRLVVSDTGAGIPDDLLPNIFEPFFTTKAGVGTGLGLATVYGIVEQAGGKIEVDTGPHGTAFYVFLPRANPTTPQSEPPPIVTRASETGKTVLLVEDERALRALASRILSGAGFRVLAADSGEAALEVLRNERATIDLLLTDVVMPGMNGVTLAEHVRSERPEVAVLLMSGYSAEDLLRRGATMPQSQLLMKPFVPSELLAAVHTSLARGPSR